MAEPGAPPIRAAAIASRPSDDDHGPDAGDDPRRADELRALAADLPGHPLCPYCLYDGAGSAVDLVDAVCSCRTCRSALDQTKLKCGVSLPLSEVAFRMVRDEMDQVHGALLADALGLSGQEAFEVSSGGIVTANAVRRLGYLNCDAGSRRRREQLVAAFEQTQNLSFIAGRIRDLLLPEPTDEGPQP